MVLACCRAAWADWLAFWASCSLSWAAFWVLSAPASSGCLAVRVRLLGLESLALSLQCPDFALGLLPVFCGLVGGFLQFLQFFTALGEGLLDGCQVIFLFG